MRRHPFLALFALVCLSFEDPDGYEVELWHELPTPVDPVTG